MPTEHIRIKWNVGYDLKPTLSEKYTFYIFMCFQA